MLVRLRRKRKLPEGVGGVLWKRGYFVRSRWRKGYFVVREGMLDYYTMRGRLKGSLVVQLVSIVTDREFEISDGEDVWALRAPTTGDRDKWVAMLGAVSHGEQSDGNLKKVLGELSPPKRRQKRVEPLILSTIVLAIYAASLGLVDYSRVHVRGRRRGLPDYRNGWRNRFAEMAFWICNSWFLVEAVATPGREQDGFFLSRAFFDGVLSLSFVSYVFVSSYHHPLWAFRLRVLLSLRPLKFVTIMPGPSRVAGKLLRVAPKLRCVLALLFLGFASFCLLGTQLFYGAQHGRCRLTAYPIKLHNWSQPCLDPDATFSKRDDHPGWTERSDSPWHEPQECWWPVDENDDRLCRLGEYGMHECYSGPSRKITQRRWCGSDFDALGNRRFRRHDVAATGYYYPRRTVYWGLSAGVSGATYLPQLQWGFTDFDNLARSAITSFTVVTMDNWTDALTKAQDASGEYLAAIYFLSLLLVGGIAGLNLFIAVLEQSRPVPAEHRRQKDDDDSDDSDDDDDDFEDVDEVKEALDEAWPLRGIVASKPFRCVFAAFVVVQALVLATDGKTTNQALLDRADDVLSHIFLAELTLQMAAFGWGYWLESHANQFNGIVTVWAVADNHAKRWGALPSQRGVASLLRTLRLADFVGLSGKLRDRATTNAVRDVLNELAAVVGLLLIFDYVCAVVGMSIFANSTRIDGAGRPIRVGTSDFDEYAQPPLNAFSNFDTLGNALISVFQLTIGANWTTVMYRLWIGTDGLTAFVYAASIVAVGSWILVNLFLSVLISSASDFATSQAEAKRQQLLNQAALLLTGLNDALRTGPALRHFLADAGKKTTSLTNAHLDAQHYILLAAEKARQDAQAARALADEEEKNEASSMPPPVKKKKKKRRRPQRGPPVAAIDEEDVVSALITTTTRSSKKTPQRISVDEIVATWRRNEARRLEAKRRAEVRFDRLRDQFAIYNSSEPSAVLPGGCSAAPPTGAIAGLDAFKDALVALALELKTDDLDQVLFSSTTTKVVTYLDVVRVFQLVDHGSTGEVTTTDLADRLPAVFPRLLPKQCLLIAESLDRDNDGIVTCDDFAAVGGAVAATKPLDVMLARHESRRDVDSIFPLSTKPTLFVFGPSHSLRLACAKLVDLSHFKHAVLITVLFSCAALLLDHPLTRPDAPSRRISGLCDVIFASLFLIEAAMKIIASGFVGSRKAYFRDGFNRVDFFLLVAAWSSLVVEFSFGVKPAAAARDRETKLRGSLRGTLDVLRILRVGRVFRTFKHVHGLRVVFTALADSVPNLLTVAGVVLGFYFVAALFAVHFLENRLKECGGDGLTDDYASVYVALATLPTMRTLLLERNNKKWSRLTAAERTLLGPASSLPGYANARCGGGVPANLTSAPCCEWNVTDGLAATIVHGKPRVKDLCRCLGYRWSKSTDVRFDNVFLALQSLVSMAAGDWDTEMYAMTSARGRGKPTNQWHTPRPEWYAVNVVFQVIFALVFLNLFVAATVDSFVKHRTKRSELTNRHLFVTDQQLELVDAATKLLAAKPKRSRIDGKVTCTSLAFVATRSFDDVVLGCVCVYALTLAVPYFGMSDDLRLGLSAIGAAFTLMFHGEAALRIAAQGFRWYWRSWWNRVDFSILLIADVGIALSQGVGSETARRVAHVALALRLLRLTRLAKRLKRFPQLAAVAGTFARLAPAVLNVFLFLAVVIFAFAVVGARIFATVQYQGTLDAHFNFRTYFRSIVTLVMLATGGDWASWMKAAARTSAGCSKSPSFSKNTCGFRDRPGCEPLDGCGTALAYPFVLVYLVVVYLVLVNVFVGVIIEAFRADEERQTIALGRGSPALLTDSTCRLHRALLRRSSQVDDALHTAKSTIDDFRIAWSRVDPDRRGAIGLGALHVLLAHLGYPTDIVRPNTGRRREVLVDPVMQCRRVTPRLNDDDDDATPLFYGFRQVLISIAIHRRGVFTKAAASDESKRRNEAFVRGVVALALLDSEIPFLARHLDLSGFGTDCPPIALAQRVARQRAALRELDLRGSTLRWHGGRALADALAHAGVDQLRVVRLASTNITTLGALAVCHVLQTAPVQVLDLADCGLDSRILAGVAPLLVRKRTLKGAPMTLALSLAHNPDVDDVHLLTRFAQSLRFAATLDLSLRGCALGKQKSCLVDFCTLLGQAPNLHVVDLAANDLDNAALLALVAGAASRRRRRGKKNNTIDLARLDLSDNPRCGDHVRRDVKYQLRLVYPACRVLLDLDDTSDPEAPATADSS